MLEGVFFFFFWSIPNHKCFNVIITVNYKLGTRAMEVNPRDSRKLPILIIKTFQFSMFKITCNLSKIR